MDFVDSLSEDCIGDREKRRGARDNAVEVEKYRVRWPPIADEYSQRKPPNRLPIHRVETAMLEINTDARGCLTKMLPCVVELRKRTPAWTRTRTCGLGGHRSIQLSYRGRSSSRFW
jgi:hypothetical protein